MTVYRRLARATLPFLLVFTSGCAAVPTGGPVLSGNAVEPEDPLANPYIRLIPAPPGLGWAPEQIVRGFLAASASFEERHAVARQYLMAEGRARWGPDRDVTVYDGGDFSLITSYTSQTNATVTFEAPKVATIDAQGQYVAATQEERVRMTFELGKAGGQWRITEPPSNLLLTRRDVSRAYRVLNLYYFEPEGQALVPDPVFVPVQARSNLATALVRALLRGPTHWLRPAVRTAFPPGVRLTSEVQVAAGTVTVDLGRRARGLSDEAAQRISAQLVWTLRQLPDMQQLRLRVAGEPVNVPGTSGEKELQTRNDWAGYRPDARAGDADAYFIRDGALMVLNGRTPNRVPGVAGTGEIPIEDPAISLDGSRVAAMDSNGYLYVGELSAEGTMQQVFPGRRFSALSWDRYGNLWAAEQRDDEARIWVLEADGDYLRVDSPELDDTTIRALRVARDGVRLAVVTGPDEESSLQLGRVVRNDDEIRAEAFLPLATDLEVVTDVAWRDADRLIVLGRGERGATLPYVVDVDGTRVSPTGSVGGMESIAAAPGSDLLAGVAGGEVWRSSDELSWQVLQEEGTDPVYPG